MKKTFTMLASLLTVLFPTLGVLHGEAPRPESPIAAAIVYSPHPQFRWEREAEVKIDEVHRIQIARDEKFADLVCEDWIEVVSRFVPVNALSPGKHWWRVQCGEGKWSAGAAFHVRKPENIFVVRAGSDSGEVARVLYQAAANGPAEVNFEPGEYLLTVEGRAGLLTLENARDLIIDGHGARVLLEGETCLLSLRNCQRVTIQNFEATSSRPGHTLVRVLEVDKANARLVVEPEPGYDPDVVRFFAGEGNGGSFLNRVDPGHHGRHLSRGFVSARDATAQRVSDAASKFYIGPVKATALPHHEEGELAVVTLYRSPFVRMDRTEECTLSHIRLVDHPGGPCMGNDNSAQSLLSVKVVRRTPSDFQGGHSGVNNGRIGAWVEGCDYECLADDGGPAHQSLRMKVERADGLDAVRLLDSWTNGELRAQDRVVFVDPRTGRFAVAEVRAVSEDRKSIRLQVSEDLPRIAAVLGIGGGDEWKGTLVYRYEPSNEDFVYRHNRHIGGRGHGVKFNGTRAWIADNYFANITGNPIYVGFTYTGAISGIGARDVVVSGNTMDYCGWTPIACISTSGVGENIIIRENRITEAREAAVMVKGCKKVNVINNDFSSASAPASGAWIAADDAGGVVARGNRYSEAAPEIKAAVIP
jgi:hypothetical protein